MNLISFNITTLGVSAFIRSILSFFKTIIGTPTVDLPLEHPT